MHREGRGTLEPGCVHAGEVSRGGELRYRDTLKKEQSAGGSRLECKEGLLSPASYGLHACGGFRTEEVGLCFNCDNN